MELSVVTTMYKSANYVREFYGRITASAKKFTEDYEIIFVNDGSPDNSLKTACELYEKDPRVKVINLSRNFGHHKAMMTGLAHAEGKRVFLLDCDLEEKPELLEEFWKEMDDSPETDVVFGVQKSRKGGWFERVSGAAFYRMFNFLASVKIVENLITVRLMKQTYVKALVSFQEKELFLAGIWEITGFNQKPLIVDKLSHNSTSYTLGRKIAILINSVTSFSNKPLMFIFYLGFFISFCTAIYIGYLIARKIFWGTTASGWTSLAVSIWFFGGLIIFCLGIIGIYLSKVFIETKNRPYTIIRDIYERKNEGRKPD